MSDILEQKINENEESYNSTKQVLEARLGMANGDYNIILKDFNSQIGYIKNNTMLSKEGKEQQTNELRGNFITKAKSKSIDHFGSLQKSLDIAIKNTEIKTIENYKGMTTDSMPQLMYVNSMVSSISSLNDADSLADVFRYASEECNFSDELINMVHMKAKNLINNHVKAKPDENPNINITNNMETSKNRKTIEKIISKIDKYKKNYSKDYTDLKTNFSRAINSGKYPSSLYIQRDIKNDFTEKKDPWSVKQEL